MLIIVYDYIPVSKYWRHNEPTENSLFNMGDEWEKNFSMICAIVGYTWYKSIRKLGGFDFI